MGDKERLEEIKSRVWRERCTYAVGDDSSREGYRYILSEEDYHWLLGQVEHRQKLLERLNKRGVEIRKLKSQLSRCREKIKKLNWNLFVTKGTADQAMRANESNYELAKKLEEENKRLREALKNIYELAEYNEYNNTLEQIVSEIEKHWRYKMTDKERLEEVDKNVVFNECGLTGAPMSVELPEDDYWYLYEQAERVQKLEKQNKRYREAINNIIEKAMLFGTSEEVYDAIQDAIKALEGME